MSVSETIRVLGISGSLRERSYNTALLRAAGEMLPPHMTLELFDLSSIPLYDADVREEGFPAGVRDLRALIREMDAILIATPEYNHSIPGVLKNTFDWISRPPDPPLFDKPVALVGATTGNYGTARAQMHLRLLFVYANMHAVNRPEVLVSRAQEKFDENLRLIDPDARAFLRQLLENLYTWTLRLRC